MSSALEQLAANGILGLLLAVALVAIGFLHRELGSERAARIQDAKDNTALLLKIQQATTDAIGKFYDLVKARQEPIPRSRVDDR
jgi:hypothetical protein